MQLNRNLWLNETLQFLLEIFYWCFRKTNLRFFYTICNKIHKRIFQLGSKSICMNFVHSTWSAQSNRTKWTRFSKMKRPDDIRKNRLSSIFIYLNGDERVIGPKNHIWLIPLCFFLSFFFSRQGVLIIDQYRSIMQYSVSNKDSSGHSERILTDWYCAKVKKISILLWGFLFNIFPIFRITVWRVQL